MSEAPLPSLAMEAAPGSPRLLLIVPTLDSHRLLPRLVASLQAQTFRHWRVLFIDGPSGPAHRSYLEGLRCRDPRFAWIAQEPAGGGIFAAMNQGFAAAGPGDWLLFWGSDDWAAGPAVLEQAAAAITPIDPPDLLVCTGRYATFSPSERGQSQCQARDPELGRLTRFHWRRSYRRSLLLGSTPPHQATWIGPGGRRRLAHYAPGFRLSADLDYFLQLSGHPGLKVRVLPLELVQMASDGVSGQQHCRRLGEVRRAYRRAFGGLWWFAFLMRYLQRLQSAAQARWTPAGLPLDAR